MDMRSRPGQVCGFYGRTSSRRDGIVHGSSESCRSAKGPWKARPQIPQPFAHHGAACHAAFIRGLHISTATTTNIKFIFCDRRRRCGVVGNRSAKRKVVQIAVESVGRPCGWDGCCVGNGVGKGIEVGTQHACPRIPRRCQIHSDGGWARTVPARCPHGAPHGARRITGQGTWPDTG